MQMYHPQVNQHYRRNMLCAIVVLYVLACGLLVLYGASNIAAQAPIFFVSVGVLVGLQFAIWRCIQTDRLDTASWLSVAPAWGFVACGSFISGGVYATEMMAFLFPILLSGILLGTKATIGFLCLTIIYVCLLFFIDMAGYLPSASERDAVFQLFIISITYIPTTMLFIYHLMKMREAEDMNLRLRLEAERMAVYRQLTHNIAHDLRTPLTVLITKTYLIRKQYERGRDITRNLDLVNDYTNKMKEMLEDFLLLTSLDEQKTQAIALDGEDFDGVNVLRETMNALESYAAQQEIHLQLHAPHSLMMHGHRTQLTQVFRHLVENGIHYGKAGGRVTIEAGECKQHTVIQVCDDGIGIAPDHHDKIFERFYRVDAARTMNEKTGSGVGLAISRQIVHLHGGTISVESEPEKGSKFTIKLPKQRQGVSEMEEAMVI